MIPGGAPRFLAVTQVCRSSTTRRRRRGRRAEGEIRGEEEEEEDLGTGRRRGTLVGLERGGGSSEEGWEFLVGEVSTGSEEEAVVSFTVDPSLLLLLGVVSARQLSREGAARC